MQRHQHGRDRGGFQRRPARDHPAGSARASRSRTRSRSSASSASRFMRNRSASCFPTAIGRATSSTRCWPKRPRRGVSPRPAHRSSDRGRRRRLSGHDRRQGPLYARAVVLATGGLSLPKTGSDGWGYQAAAALGHSIVPTTPALAPLVLDAERRGRGPRGRVRRRAAGANRRPRGRQSDDASGRIAPLDALRRQRAGGARRVTALAARPARAARGRRSPPVFCPDERFESLDAAFLALARSRAAVDAPGRPRRSIPARSPPRSSRGSTSTPRARWPQLTRDTRHRLTRALLEWPLPVPIRAATTTRRSRRAAFR